MNDAHPTYSEESDGPDSEEDDVLRTPGTRRWFCAVVVMVFATLVPASAALPTMPRWSASPPAGLFPLAYSDDAPPPWFVQSVGGLQRSLADDWFGGVQLYDGHHVGIGVVYGDAGDPLERVVTEWYDGNNHKEFDLRVPTDALSYRAPLGDQHMVVVDQTQGIAVDVYEFSGSPGAWRGLYASDAYPVGGNMDLDGSTAAGVSLFAGTVKADEWGPDRAIGHALIGPFPRVPADWVSPRTVYPSNGRSDAGHWEYRTGDVPYGGRLVLDPSVDLDGLGLSWEAYRILEAWQDYGWYLVDYGGVGGVYMDNRIRVSQSYDNGGTRSDIEEEIASVLRGNLWLADEPDSGTFGDVIRGSYYENAVMWMLAEGITSGTSPNRFSPDADTTRAQFVTFLWRHAGRPGAASSPAFVDVQPGSFYASAVAWAQEAGIVTGQAPFIFAPHDPITRAEAATIIWRYMGWPPASSRAYFYDVPVGSFYENAVDALSERGIITGVAYGVFAPNRQTSRAEAATLLWRMAGEP